MSYVSPNFKTKKALKQAVQEGKHVSVFNPGLGSPNMDGVNFIEGPHYPEPHKWYAKVLCKAGMVLKVMS